MGRKATIDQRDVARAREGLRADGLPHGIIAIRNRLGRGSPQLIARFLSEPELLMDGRRVVTGRADHPQDHEEHTIEWR